MNSPKLLQFTFSSKVLKHSKEKKATNNEYQRVINTNTEIHIQIQNTNTNTETQIQKLHNKEKRLTDPKRSL